jgi:hypothetical protein
VGALRNDSVRIRFDHEVLALEQLFGHVLWRNANSWDFCQTDGGRLRLVGRGVTGRSGQASTDQAETRVEGRSARLVARGTGEAQRLRSCATSLFKRSRVHRHAERFRRGGVTVDRNEFINAALPRCAPRLAATAAFNKSKRANAIRDAPFQPSTDCWDRLADRGQAGRFPVTQGGRPTELESQEPRSGRSSLPSNQNPRLGATSNRGGILRSYAEEAKQNSQPRSRFQ